MKNESTPPHEGIYKIGFYLDRILFSLIKILNRELKEENCDIRQPEFSIMQTLSVRGSMSQSSLAKILGKERSGISRSVKLLESKGYIKRDPLNGSTNQVDLTEAGKLAIPGFIEMYNRVVDGAFKGLSEKSRQSIMKNLDKIYQNIEEE